MLHILLFIAGFVLLVLGASWLVDGASALARRFHLSEFAVGLTIVAFGTSTPELFVNIQAAVKGDVEIAIGNVIGSNNFNILIILGISSLLYPLSITRGTVWKEIPFCLLAALLLGLQANDSLFDHARCDVLDRIDGIVFLAFFVIFLYYIAGIMKQTAVDAEPVQRKIYSPPYSIFLILAGLVGLILGSNWVVQGAILIAVKMGVSQRVIALTLVAAGTSFPELATSVVASFKRNSSIAVGNIIGSNIFNIFLILGITSLIRPLAFQPFNRYDLLLGIISSLLLFIFMFTGKNKKLDRWEGGLMIGLFLVYLIFILVK